MKSNNKSLFILAKIGKSSMSFKKIWFNKFV